MCPGPVRGRGVGLRVGVRMVDGVDVKPLVFDLGHHPVLLLCVEPVGHLARVGVAHRVEAERDALLAGDQAAGLVWNLRPGLRHDLIERGAVELDHEEKSINGVGFVRSRGCVPPRPAPGFRCDVR